MGRTLVYTICCLPLPRDHPSAHRSARHLAPCTPPKSLSRTMIYIPVLMSALVVGITINWMFSQEYGLINFIIQSFGGTPLEWSLNSGLATFVIGFASVWASIGFNMIIYVGGINNISPDLYEAASIDGANSFQSFPSHHGAHAQPHHVPCSAAFHGKPAQGIRFWYRASRRAAPA